MSSRAAFVSAGGDPYLLLFHYKLFRERFYDEVDTYYVNYNLHSPIPKSVAGEVLNELSQDKKVHIIYHPDGIGNGLPITEMTLLSKEDLVMLVEDDGFIFKGGIVNDCFHAIESKEADMVGSQRFSCAMEIAEALKKKYNLDYSGYGDVGPNFWPNFFFCKRKDLLKTDLNFGSINFQSGQYVPELDHTFKEEANGDTFVWGCIQLRHLGLKPKAVPQHHADPYEIQNKQRGEMNWQEDQKPFMWIHGGSLSTSIGGYLSGRMPDLSNESAILETETRVAFWTICSDVVNKFPNLLGEYRAGIDNLITEANLDRKRIGQKIKIYRELMNV